MKITTIIKNPAKQRTFLIKLLHETTINRKQFDSVISLCPIVGKNNVIGFSYNSEAECKLNAIFTYEISRFEKQGYINLHYHVFTLRIKKGC